MLQVFANFERSLPIFGRELLQPVRYATGLEAGIIAGVGLALLVAELMLSHRGRRSPAYEAVWTDKRLQFTGVFGTVALLLAFLRYEGIPYGSMTLVLVLTILWMLITVAQLLRYRRLVVQVARAGQSEHRARDAYLPQPKRRSAR